MTGLKEKIREAGLALGFARVGFAAAGPLPHRNVLAQWLDEGMHGEMAFMRSHVDRANPADLLPDVKSLIVGACRYSDGKPETPQPGRGRVARYARGADYHAVLKGPTEPTCRRHQTMDR